MKHIETSFVNFEKNMTTNDSSNKSINLTLLNENKDLKLKGLQKELYMDFLEDGIINKDLARGVVGMYANTADKLLEKGIFTTLNGHQYWIRQEGDPIVEPQYVFIIFGGNFNDDGSILAALKASKKYKWRDIIKAALKLFREKGGGTNSDAQVEGQDWNWWETTKKPKYEFDGNVFIRR